MYMAHVCVNVCCSDCVGVCGMFSSRRHSIQVVELSHRFWQAAVEIRLKNYLPFDSSINSINICVSFVSLSFLDLIVISLN